MTRHPWLTQGLLGMLAFVGVGVADAGVIYPISPATGLPNLTSAVTLSVFDSGGRDITDTWLPTWQPGPNGAPTVYLAFNFQGTSAVAAVNAQPPASAIAFNGTVNPFVTLPVSTSAYPGNCTNFGSSTDLTPDYTLSLPAQRNLGGVTRQAFGLTSHDCGGMAVIVATVNNTTQTFIVPQDSNLNGIPDIAEARFCPNNSCPTGREDNDAGPVAGTPIGDAIAAFDEYRGFIVSGAHVATDPRQRDIFIHLVNPQCGGTSLLGGGTLTIPTDNGSLFANLATLAPGSQFHFLSFAPGQTNGTTAEWVDRFSSFSQQSGFQYVGVGGIPTSVAPADDRRINANAIFPLGSPNPFGGRAIHKGLRITECTEASSGVLGSTGIGSPDGPDNSLLYTHRIQASINSLIDAGSGRKVRLLMFQNGAWVSTYAGAGAPTDTDRNIILSAAMRFYAAHELTHSTRLTPTVQGTRQTSYGYHHAPGTGSVMDQAIVQKIDKNAAGFNSFYIPALYNGNDQGNFATKD